MKKAKCSALSSKEEQEQRHRGGPQQRVPAHRGRGDAFKLCARTRRIALSRVGAARSRVAAPRRGGGGGTGWSRRCVASSMPSPSRAPAACILHAALSLSSVLFVFVCSPTVLCTHQDAEALDDGDFTGRSLLNQALRKVGTHRLSSSCSCSCCCCPHLAWRGYVPQGFNWSSPSELEEHVRHHATGCTLTVRLVVPQQRTYVSPSSCHVDVRSRASSLSLSLWPTGGRHGRLLERTGCKFPQRLATALAGDWNLAVATNVRCAPHNANHSHLWMTAERFPFWCADVPY